MEPTVTGVPDTPEAVEAAKQFAQGASPNPKTDAETAYPEDPSQPPKLIGGDLNPEYRGHPEVAGRTPPGEQPTEDGRAPVGDNDDRKVIQVGDQPGADQRTDPETGAPRDPNFQSVATTGEPVPGSTADAGTLADLRTDPVAPNPVPPNNTVRPADDTPPLSPNRDATTIRNVDPAPNAAPAFDPAKPADKPLAEEAKPLDTTKAAEDSKPTFASDPKPPVTEPTPPDTTIGDPAPSKKSAK